MFGKRKNKDLFFKQLCVEYYEKILRYLYSSLGDETAARDCTQEVFLVACQKSELLGQHPNPGGFLFQTAKNLARKTRREGFSRLAREISSDSGIFEQSDIYSEIEAVLDSEIDELEYVETVLSSLSTEKRRLYSLYYINKNSMAEIASLLELEEAAVRMRFVRLRREIREIVDKLAEEKFTV